MTLDLQLTEADVEAAIAPYVRERLAPTEPRWKEIVRKARQKHRVRLTRRLEGRAARTQDDVVSTYTRHWSGDLDALFARTKPVAFQWGDQRLLMAPPARRRLNHLLLTKALAAVGARRILEVGMGNGSNLFLLAAQEPALDLTGLELTVSGMAAAQAIAREPEIPELIAQLSSRPITAPRAHHQVKLVQGTAAGLPFADGTFDTVFTVLALEQMEAIQDQALAEIRRVSSRWVIMIEPFRDLNATGVRADYVRAHDYFSETIDGLAAHGLQPRAVYSDIRNKMRLHIGLVVAERS
jgi:SAM-dependent methyltransferase